MGFQFPDAFLFLLILPPVLWLVWRGNVRSMEIAVFFEGRPPGRWFSYTRLAFVSLFVVALVAVGARPYLVPSVTGDYLFISDVSRSMDARQSCGEPTLLQRSKYVMRQVLEGVPEGKFGILAFERLAFPVTQMTYDHDYLNEVIEHGLFVGLIYERTATQISNVLTAVARKKAQLPKIYGQVNYAIFLTDGNVSASEEGRFRESLALLNQAGIHLLMVGIGGAGATPIPIVENGKCLDDYIAVDGKVVSVSLRADILQTFASETQGRYFGEGETRELVKFLRERTLQRAPADTEFGIQQRRDASWMFLALATAALFGIVLLGINIRLGRGGGMFGRWRKQ